MKSKGTFHTRGPVPGTDMEILIGRGGGSHSPNAPSGRGVSEFSISEFRILLRATLIHAMALRTWTGVGFVRRAPTADGGTIDLRVSALEPAQALWWHSRVQPIIDEDPSRPDEDWNWLLYGPFTYTVGKVLARQPVGYAVGVERRDSGAFVPCGLALLLGRNPAFDDHTKRSAFTWFLTTAPKQALLDLPEYGLEKDRLPKALGSITLDVAVTHSFNHRGHGRVGLHADEKGGDALLDWYLGRGMTILPEEKKLPPGPRRIFSPSDGRYCYYTIDAAIEASRSLDNLR